MTTYGSGTCNPLPWQLASKHSGGISKILLSPSPREHYVHRQEKAGGKKNCGGGAEKIGNFRKLLSLHFFNDDEIDKQNKYSACDTGMSP